MPPLDMPFETPWIQGPVMLDNCMLKPLQIEDNTLTDKVTKPLPQAVDCAADKYYPWLFACILGVTASFTINGIVLEHATSGGRQIHEVPLIFVISLISILTGYLGRWYMDEPPADVSARVIMMLGFSSLGSTWTSTRSLRYVVFPIKVLAKTCKPIPVMIVGSCLGKYYPLRRWCNVLAIVAGVALFMCSGSSGMHNGQVSVTSQAVGMFLLFTSLCFDGSTGAFEDKVMSTRNLGPFSLMLQTSIVKTIVAALLLVAHYGLRGALGDMEGTGLLCYTVLGVTGALGQLFVFITISKFGALTCSVIGLTRKMITLVSSILIFGHLHGSSFMQGFGLALAMLATVVNFLDRSGKGHKKVAAVKPDPPLAGSAPGILHSASCRNFQNHSATPGQQPSPNIRHSISQPLLQLPSPVAPKHPHPRNLGLPLVRNMLVLRSDVHLLRPTSRNLNSGFAVSCTEVIDLPVLDPASAVTAQRRNHSPPRNAPSSPYERDLESAAELPLAAGPSLPPSHDSPSISEGRLHRWLNRTRTQASVLMPGLKLQEPLRSYPE